MRLRRGWGAEMTRTLFALFLILGGFVALQWHDADVERRIASHDCQGRTRGSL